jgi:hypothetical protein
MYIDFIKYIYLDKFILIIENHLSIKVSLSLLKSQNDQSYYQSLQRH